MNSIISFVRSKYYEYLRIPFVRKVIFRKLRIKDSIDTINYIIETKCSVSRYGDGELDVIFGGERGFQKYDAHLASRLREVLSSKNLNHIVCLPYPFIKSDFLRESSDKFWSYYIGMNAIRLRKIIDLKKSYYDTEISRFYIDYADRRKCHEHIVLLKQIWEKRNVIIVEGCHTASGVGNDLFNNVASVRRIICPAENAFEVYSKILNSVVHHSSKDSLILLSLGMTATVLAYDLAKEGLQAIDLGHLDIEYEWFLRNADWKTVIPGKYVNEVEGGNKVICINDENYIKQIIARI